METFMKVYAAELEKAVRDYPDEYRYTLDVVPGVVELMREAIQQKSYNKDSRAFRQTCKVLGIKCTYKAIDRFIASHV